MELPKPFLKSRLSGIQPNPEYSCICAGFGLKKWRFERLAAHLVDWLPDFAIRQDALPSEIANITDYRKLLESAAARIYKTEKTKHRGEIGELLLHAACRQFSGTFPAISKIYYKDSSNHTVKGFDLVHTRYEQDSGELQLWLGEAILSQQLSFWKAVGFVEEAKRKRRAFARRFCFDGLPGQARQ